MGTFSEEFSDPFLKKALGIEFESVLVKGRGNYICLRKIQALETGLLADWILRDNLPVRMQIQLHKYLWGDVPGR